MRIDAFSNFHIE